MEIDLAKDFIRQHHRAVLATTKRDGSPQMSPVSVGIDDDGYAVISSRRHLAKVRNLERTPQASLCVFTSEFFGPWIQVDGPVEIRHVQVHGCDDAHDCLDVAAAARFARSFFLRWRSFFQRLIGLEPLPMD